MDKSSAPSGSSGGQSAERFRQGMGELTDQPQDSQPNDAPLFPSFSKLPPEIRCQIWEFALPRRVLRQHSVRSHHGLRPPVVAQVSRESRAVATAVGGLRRLTCRDVEDGELCCQVHTWFDRERDTVEEFSDYYAYDETAELMAHSGLALIPTPMWDQDSESNFDRPTVWYSLKKLFIRVGKWLWVNPGSRCSEEITHLFGEHSSVLVPFPFDESERCKWDALEGMLGRADDVVKMRRFRRDPSAELEWVEEILQNLLVGIATEEAENRGLADEFFAAVGDMPEEHLDDYALIIEQLSPKFPGLFKMPEMSFVVGFTFVDPGINR